MSKSQRRRRARVTLPKLGTAKLTTSQIEMTTVDDPFDGKPLAVAKNVRVHPLDQMKARGRITETQKLVGDRFLAIYDRSQIGGAKAIDYSKVKVDVSFSYDGLDEAAMAATDSLKRICNVLGRRAYALLVNVIGLRMSASDLARRANGSTDDHLARHVAASLKDALDDLDDYFGKTRGKVHAVEPYSRTIRALEGRIDMPEPAVA